VIKAKLFANERVQKLNITPIESHIKEQAVGL
jgi:hypothetical protein